LIEDGIVNWVNNYTNFIFIKSILYSLIFNKFIFLNKNWLNDSLIKTIIISNFDNKIYNFKHNYIYIKNDFDNYIFKSKINNQFFNQDFNILVLCAKEIHYTDGIKIFF